MFPLNPPSFLNVRPKDEVQHDVLIGIAQQTLQKHAFEDFQGLMLACKHEDYNKSGELDRKTLRRIMLAQHLPIPDDMLNTLMDL